MRTRLVTTVIFLVIAVAAIGTANASGFFTDDDGSVHLRAIEAIADEGITRGCNPPTNDLYCPSAVVTREQMASFLVRALDLPDGSATFTDLGTSVHAADIGALATAGITRGCNPPTNDLFCPQDPVTREQMASFLARALGLDTSPRIVVTADQDLAGIAVGTAEDDAVTQLTALFGPPTNDEAAACPYFLPDNNMRYLRWGSLIVAVKTVDSGDGKIGLVGWRYKLDAMGNPEVGGPLAGHIEMPLGLELLDPIGDAVAAGGGAIETTPFTWTIVAFDDFTVEATGLSVDPNALIDGVQQGFGFNCE
ncbi:MAG: S-layer homology domain-containing protein [Actinomycetota bacterium]|nr:S-layer homology domain-containing protein [Actinomycetota bacterium]